MPKARINQAFIQKARHAPGFHWDSGDGAIKGFGVRCDRDGRPYSYVFQKRGSTRQVIGRIGADDDKDALPLADARDAAKALAAKAPPKKVLPSSTLEDGLAAHIESMRERQCSERSVALIDFEVRRYATDYLGTRLNRFAHEDIVKLHKSATIEVLEDGDTKRRPVAGNRIVRHLSAIFGTADVPFPMQRKWWKKHRNKTNDEGTPPIHDLAAFGAALRKLPNAAVADWWRLALLTALRKEDGLSIRRDEVGAKRAGWLYRPNPKGGRFKAFEFPLPTQAQTIIDRQPAFADNPYLFPSTRKTGSHIVNVGKPAGVTRHQARATWISRAAELGCPMPVIKRLVNHSGKKRDVTEGYITVSDKVLQLWAQRVADSLWAELNGAASSTENATPETGARALQERANVH